MNTAEQLEKLTKARDLARQIRDYEGHAVCGKLAHIAEREVDEVITDLQKNQSTNQPKPI